ncbi:MAG: hypothetical protein WC516_08220 [Patescibacteria group bacterium]|jgi:hypothetical protein
MRRKKTIEEFINEANKVHNNKYDYSKYIYIDYKMKGIIICPKHGEFLQNPSNHLCGFGCQRCKGDKLRELRGFTIKQFIEKSNKIHNNKYNYSKFIYINNNTKGIILCQEHGEFEQIPAYHFKGQGCPKCGRDKAIQSRTSSELEFIEKANLAHNKNYDYNKVSYVNARIKVCIICQIHGDFYQTPDSHLRGNGCPKCCHIVSKKSQIWLDWFNNPNIVREKFIYVNNKKYIVDGVDFTTNTIYEFYGDFWHGNPNMFKADEINLANKKTFGQLYNNTIKREAELKLAGYNLVCIWEEEFES